MASASKVTFEVPADLRALMDKHPEVNWSAVFRQALVRHARALEIAREIAAEEDDRRVSAVGQRLKAGTAERFRGAKHARRR